MSRLVDLFGYFGILLHGLEIIAQSMAVGGAVFLVLLARPFRAAIGEDIAVRTAAIGALAAAALALAQAIGLALQSSVLMDTVGLSLGNVLTAGFAVAALIKIAAAITLGVMLWARAPALQLGMAAGVELVAATLTTHAAARLHDNQLLLAAELLHQLGAAIWIGGIPCFVMALGRLRDTAGFRLVGGRFSRLSAVGVACILVSGLTMSVFYIGGWPAFYGTAFGVMVGAKVALFAMLLVLGAGNLLVTERLRRGGNAPVARMRRFAEVEIGIGFTVFFAAASLTSVPPAIDLTQDRATWQQIVARDFTPHWPRLRSPEYDRLGIPALQAQLDAHARAQAAEPRAAFIEGTGDLPPRNADDIAWSEYNHHWAGLFVLAVAALALLAQSGLRWARHWPLVFLGLAGFLFLRSDPEVWPLGRIGLLESLRDVEVVQHRGFVLLTVVFAGFEWCVRTGRLGGRWAYVFPLLIGAGGALLLTHSHAIANVRDALLIEWTHTPLALLAVAAGASRWLELRSDGSVARLCGWLWPVCFLLIGLLLLFYREA